MPPPACPPTMFVVGSLLSPYVVVPIAGGVMALLALHLASLKRTPHPPSRRRIRSANALIMLAIVPLFAVGVSLISAQRNPRLWLLLWLAVISLVWMSVMLALLDMVNTLRMARVRRRKLQRMLTQSRGLRIAPGAGSDDAS